MIADVVPHTPGYPTALHPTAVHAMPGARCVPMPGLPAALRPAATSACSKARLPAATLEGLIPSNALAHCEINSQEGAVITFHLPLHKYVEIKAAHSAEPTNTRR